MKFIYGIFKLILALGMLTFGIAMLFMEFEEFYAIVDDYYEQGLTYLPPELWVREIVAGIIAFVGLIVLWSIFRSVFPKQVKVRSISFPGMHGEVSIDLKDVEGTLERVAMKLPEVLKASIVLEPTDSTGRAMVLATVVLIKDADDDARMVTARVQHYLQIHTKKILGLQDVDVRLKVKQFKMKMKTLKAEPLLLEGPFGHPVEAAMAAAGAAPEQTTQEVVPEATEISSDSDLELEK